MVSELIHCQANPVHSLAYTNTVGRLIHIFNEEQPLELCARMELAWALACREQTPFSPPHAESFLREARFVSIKAAAASKLTPAILSSTTSGNPGRLRRGGRETRLVKPCIEC